ncbi:hypothetical protein D3C85_1580890 [compost metagenome]
MATPRLATGLVMRNTATASGRTRPAVARLTPSMSTERSTMTGRLASDDWVEKATTWAGAAARANRPRLTRPKMTASG